MKAWSLAWNTADVPLVDSAVRLIQVRRTGMSFILNDGAVFTGETLFTDGVGRPDLQADADAARARARALFRSIERLRELRGDLVVLPAHASEPIAFDGVPVAARLADVDRWLTQWMASESAFVAHVTSNLPPPPPNVARIVHINETGEAAASDPTDLEAGANRCAVR